MLNPKTIHYPSGYPMARSPPLFICSSPGPDPYRSHDNVYEELEQRRDVDSERLHRSDDEFAEDELSLAGERSFHKSSPDTTTVATIYQDGAGSSSTETAYMERNRTERNSLLSSSSSGNDNLSVGNRPSIRASNSSSDCGGSSSGGTVGLGLSLFRCRSSNNNKNRRLKPSAQSADELNTSTALEPNNSEIPPIIYDHRSLISLPPSYSSAVHNNNFVNNNLDGATNGDVHNHVNNNHRLHQHLHHHHHNHDNNSNANRANYYGSATIEDEVERRNRINSQLSQHPVATIYRERGGRLHHPQRMRTNPRSLDRRRLFPNAAPVVSYDPNYADAMLYDSCLQYTGAPTYSTAADRQPIYPYILPEFTTFRHQNGGTSNVTTPTTTTAPPPSGMSYSRDNSFGSDSGYSHNTQNSSRSAWGNTANGRRPSKEQSNVSGALSPVVSSEPTTNVVSS